MALSLVFLDPLVHISATALNKGLPRSPVSVHATHWSSGLGGWNLELWNRQPTRPCLVASVLSVLSAIILPRPQSPALLPDLRLYHRAQKRFNVLLILEVHSMLN